MQNTPESTMNPTLTDSNKHLDAAAKAVVQAGSELQAAASDGANRMTDAAVKEATRISDLARDWMQRYARSAMDAAGTVRDQALVANERTQRYVRDEPVKAVLIAAAAGAVVTGLLMMATRDRR